MEYTLCLLVIGSSVIIKTPLSFNQGWKNITITPLVIVSYRYFYITITNEAYMITNDN